ncbi:MAG: FAD-binding protein [Rhodospirillales bacterium]|jgi:glycolate oxidase FAD binding subunit|nr:FAD-binding protein [Rhodospirillales bacterium]
MSEKFKAQSTKQIEEAISWALANETSLEVIGGGSKRAFGRPGEAGHLLDLSAISGVVNYEPKELVMSALPGTPLAEIEAALEPNRQELAFEPADLGPLFGTGAGGSNLSGTIGGAFACNLSGPKRIRIGAARDHILGFQAVSGRGEAFKSGGRMFKNVTGFDLSKLFSGSFGTLSVFTELTFKVLPAAETVHTVLVFGLTAMEATRAMTKALHSSNEVSGVAHLPADVAAVSGVAPILSAGGAVTAVRVEGFGPSVDYRCNSLVELLGGFGETGLLETDDSQMLWREVRDVSYFARESQNQVWRISTPPGEGARVAAQILQARPGKVYFDWGGGLLWLSLEAADDAAHEAVRGALGDTGGHATLVRADEAVRARVPVFHPQPGPLAALTGRVKESLDPKGVLNPGRMFAGV